MGTGNRAGGLQASAVMQISPTAVPISGGTVSITNTAMTGLTVINPAGVLAVLTVNLPSDASSNIGQVERISFLKGITLLTIAGATVTGAPVAASINDNIGFQKVAANTWQRTI